jgi:hypothetical protein
MEVHARAAVRRWDASPTARNYVHAVLLNDPVNRWNSQVLRHLAGRREPLELNSWEATEALCSRHVRVVYLMTFHPEEDDACPQCKQLMIILQRNPEQYPEEARRVAQEVAERERRIQERRNAEQQRETAHRKAKRFLEGVDEFDEDEPPPAPDLMELLKRDRNDPEASGTA